MLCDVLTIPFFVRIARRREANRGTSELAGASMADKIILFSSKAIYIPALIYSIFLPLRLGTMWFYVGLAVTIIGLITQSIVVMNWISTPPDEPVIRGLYRYSRHPMYITGFIFYLGISIASASWVFLLFSLVFTVVSFAIASAEEKSCLEQYGNTYREYMNRTPRWIGIPKSVAK
jgi:protein-S-isoprenylcysteine O-methyltransferase Ste14